MDLYMIYLIISILSLKYIFGFFLRLSLCHAPLKDRYALHVKGTFGKYDARSLVVLSAPFVYKYFWVWKALV